MICELHRIRIFSNGISGAGAIHQWSKNATAVKNIELNDDSYLTPNQSVNSTYYLSEICDQKEKCSVISRLQCVT